MADRFRCPGRDIGGPLLPSSYAQTFTCISLFAQRNPPISTKGCRPLAKPAAYGSGRPWLPTDLLSECAQSPLLTVRSYPLPQTDARSPLLTVACVEHNPSSTIRDPQPSPSLAVFYRPLGGEEFIMYCRLYVVPFVLLENCIGGPTTKSDFVNILYHGLARFGFWDVTLTLRRLEVGNDNEEAKAVYWHWGFETLPGMSDDRDPDPLWERMEVSLVEVGTSSWDWVFTFRVRAT